MDGLVNDYVKYRDGHSDLGRQAISGKIIALSSNLTFQRLDGRGLISIPWENFTTAHQGVLHKEGLADVGAFLLSRIPILELFATSYHLGLWVAYWDNEIERNQDIFFETGSERRGEQIARKIIQSRDQYHRQKKSVSSPQRRKASPQPQRTSLEARKSSAQSKKASPQTKKTSTQPKKTSAQSKKTSSQNRKKK